MSTTPESPPNTITPQLDDASSILLLAPALDPDEDEACIDLLTVTDPASENVLSITFTQSPDDRLNIWQTYVDELPAQAGIIGVDMMTRSASTGETSFSQEIPDRIAIEAVTDPGDLTGLGITISNFIFNWKGSTNQTVVCFHSLTPLLQYADLQRVFRFLHVLTGQLKSIDAVAHFHLDPSAHDEQTISTLSQLFDAIVEHDDGGYTIRTA